MQLELVPEMPIHLIPYLRIILLFIRVKYLNVKFFGQKSV